MHAQLFKGSILIGALALLLACSGSESVSAPRDVEDKVADTVALSAIAPHPYVDVCDHGTGGMYCHAKKQVQSATPNTANSGPWGGYGPTDLASAYNVPASSKSGGLTVAIVDAYDDPTAESDLAIYRQYYGLPACTSANGCFKKVNESGATSPLPSPDSGWSGEISLDLDMVSAMCPDCKILLVEGSQASITDLGTAVNTAVTLGAAAVSNSYGGGEFSIESLVTSWYYSHPGILITASSGDSGYGAQYPAASAGVLAVGGTTLTKSASARGWAESAWAGGGAGCSGYTTKPSWQTDTLCANRTEADVSAIADPNTGVAVVQSGMWEVYGGTSVSSPLIAALFTRLGLAKSASIGGLSVPFSYAHPSAFYDVTTGSDGQCASSASHLCTAGVGYDGPTGVGTPNSTLLMNPNPADAGADAKAPTDAALDVAPADTGAEAKAPVDTGTDAIAADASTDSGVDAGPPPSFQLAVAQLSVTLPAAQSTTEGLTVTVTGGFNSTVALSVTGLPSGVTASFSPTSVTGAGKSVLTLSATAKTTVGTYALSVVGTGPTLTSKAAVSLSVTPQFTLSTSTSSLNVTAGQGSASTTLTLTGISVGATISLAPIPAGLTMAISGTGCTTSGTCTAKLTLQASATTALGTYKPTLSATQSGVVESVPVTVVIAPAPSFSMTLASSALTVVAGASGTLRATVAGNTTWNSAVALSVTGLPTGVTVQQVSLAAPGTGTAALTVAVGANTVAGSYSLSVVATGAGVSHSQLVTLTVQPAPTFALSLSASSLKVAPGASGTVTATIAPNSTFTSSIAVSTTGMPSSVTVSTGSISPPNSKSAPLTVAVGAKVAAGTYPLTVTASGGNVKQTSQLSLIVASPTTAGSSGSPTTGKTATK